jgi:hypothetical protein
MTDDDDGMSDHRRVEQGIREFLRSGQRRPGADDLGGAAGLMAGAARGGIVGGLAGAVLAPVADAAGHKIAQWTGLEPDPEDK